MTLQARQTAQPQPSFTSFDGHQRLASGSLASVALTVKHALERGATGPVLMFDDRSGRVVDVDTRGSDDEFIARLAAISGNPDHASDTETVTDTVIDTESSAMSDGPRGRGRPKLGVTAREVTLLPRHWDWLAEQPGGASVALRKLVEDARRAASGKDRTRKAHERAYHFISAIAGDLPGFEEATRALFADDRTGFSTHTASWPKDVRDYALLLAFDKAA
ncbi:DUF2239 family protein [Permianibacter sp. IMCC34836]|uniref:DUF2239 family protein n=1 Tax=Permianibacter fluminis TaxID=2738515 RepID=UPI0015528E55|nr:DUF2239 family protein [Permianibacter fluminis]NQD37173.1 DUF2239 family protein [Permianibacter fluminis]